MGLYGGLDHLLGAGSTGNKVNQLIPIHLGMEVEGLSVG